MTREPDPRRQRLRFGFFVPQAELFSRDDAPGSRAPDAWWEYALELIDFGGAVFLGCNSVRPGRDIRDLVTAALLRRALITSEAITRLLHGGLFEPALATSRTLLDIQLNLTLVTRDSSDRTAKKLAAYHYLSAKRHGQRMLSDSSTREMLSRYADQLEWTLQVTRAQKMFFESDAFAEIRDDVAAGRLWHGYRTAEEAFRAVGMVREYVQSYDLETFYVHVTNVDWDMSEIEHGRVNLKTPITTEAEKLSPALADALGRLYTIIKMFIEDRPGCLGMIEPPDQTTDPDSIHVDTLSGLAGKLVGIFGTFDDVPPAA